MQLFSYLIHIGQLHTLFCVDLFRHQEEFCAFIEKVFKY